MFNTSFETYLLISLGVLGLTAYTWFVVELAWEIVIRRMDRYEQEREEEMARLDRMME